MATTNSMAVEQPASNHNHNNASATLQANGKASATTSTTTTSTIPNGHSSHSHTAATANGIVTSSSSSTCAAIPASSSSSAAPPTTSSSLITLSSKPTFLEVKPMRFVIMDAPRQTNLHLYVKELSKYHVQDIVRVCEPTYHGDSLQNAGIGLHDMEYHDGHSPPNDVMERWLSLVEKTFYNPSTNNNTNHEDVALAVHCVAGLGRAPVLVAIALIEFAHMDPVEAVTLIRRHRRGAINEKQLIYLEGYKRTYKRKLGGGSGASTGCSCVIM